MCHREIPNGADLGLYKLLCWEKCFHLYSGPCDLSRETWTVCSEAYFIYYFMIIGDFNLTTSVNFELTYTVIYFSLLMHFAHLVFVSDDGGHPCQCLP